MAETRDDWFSVGVEEDEEGVEHWSFEWSTRRLYDAIVAEDAARRAEAEMRAEQQAKYAEYDAVRKAKVVAEFEAEQKAQLRGSVVPAKPKPKRAAPDRLSILKRRAGP